MKLVLLITLLLSLYLMGGIYLYFKQADFIYSPTAKVKHPYPIEVFKNGDVSIDVICLNQGNKAAILYFGGNAEQVAASATDFLQHFPSHTVYLVNYRGYGGSSGSPDEQGFYTDALHIFDHIQNRHTNITVIGRSLGTAVATLIAAKRKIQGLALATPFDSIQNIAQGAYPIFPMGLLLNHKFKSIENVKHIKVPTLIFIAEFDEVIPLKNTVRLIKAFPSSQVTVETLKGADHNSFLNQEQYLLSLKKFILRMK